MFERFHRKATPAALGAVLAAMGVGGIAAAQNAHTASSPAKAATTKAAEVPGQESTTGPDTDTLKQGDQITPDTPAAAPAKAVNSAATTTPDKPTPGDTADPSSTAPDTPTPGDTADSSSTAADTPTPGDTADPAGEAPGSEVAGNDGPGGHADEPGNPNATTQQEGAH